MFADNPFAFENLPRARVKADAAALEICAVFSSENDDISPPRRARSGTMTESPVALMTAGELAAKALQVSFINREESLVCLMALLKNDQYMSRRPLAPEQLLALEAGIKDGANDETVFCLLYVLAKAFKVRNVRGVASPISVTKMPCAKLTTNSALYFFERMLQLGHLTLKHTTTVSAFLNKKKLTEIFAALVGPEISILADRQLDAAVEDVSVGQNVAT